MKKIVFMFLAIFVVLVTCSCENDSNIKVLKCSGMNKGNNMNAYSDIEYRFKDNKLSNVVTNVTFKDIEVENLSSIWDSIKTQFTEQNAPIEIVQPFAGIIILIFANRKDMTNPFIVVLDCDGQKSEEAALDFLQKHTRRCVIKSKTARKGAVELNLEVRLRNTNTDFINQLTEIDGVQSAVLVSYNGDYMG